MYVEAGGDKGLTIGRIEDFEEFLIKCGYTLVRSQEDSFQTKKMLVDETGIYYREEDINSDKKHIGYYNFSERIDQKWKCEEQENYHL